MLPLISNINLISATLHIPKLIVWGIYFTGVGTTGYCTKKAIQDILKQNKGIAEEKQKEQKQETEIERKVRIEKETEQLKLDKQQNEIDANNVVNDTAESRPYSGIKAPNLHCLLWGYSKDYEPVWGDATNYIVTGTTKFGKSRKSHVMILNFLANKQGTMYIVDLKKTDYKLYVGCKGVKLYIDELEQVKEAVEAFQQEYNRRIELINAGYTDQQGIHRPYIDIDDYNQKNPDKIEKDFVLYIDEYADISDTYKDRNGRPIGVYAQIIQLARKCRCAGGRVILATQRASCTVVIGELKNNCEFVAMGCLNECNSKISIDVAGCEKLQKREALMYINNKLTKVFSYDLSNEQLYQLTDKLKEAR